jgi:hypothetical protein
MLAASVGAPFCARAVWSGFQAARTCLDCVVCGWVVCVAARLREVELFCRERTTGRLMFAFIAYRGSTPGMVRSVWASLGFFCSSVWDSRCKPQATTCALPMRPSLVSLLQFQPTRLLSLWLSQRCGGLWLAGPRRHVWSTRRSPCRAVTQGCASVLFTLTHQVAQQAAWEQWLRWCSLCSELPTAQPKLVRGRWEVLQQLLRLSPGVGISTMGVAKPEVSVLCLVAGAQGG